MMSDNDHERSLRMNNYAQTNLQLYGQMLSSERPEQESKLARDAYELAMCLFASQYRGNGKPFVSHLVGVASILTAQRRPIDAITAGLLHSVYTFGEFGDGTRGIKKRKRNEVRNVVGAAAEELIVQYTLIDWNLPTLRDFQSRAAMLTAAQKDVLAIKAADVLEDHLDRGLDYIPTKHLASKTDNIALLEALIALSREAGHAEIAAELQSVSTQSPKWQIPTTLTTTRSSSFLAAPRSHCKRMLPRVNRRLSRWFRAKAA